MSLTVLNLSSVGAALVISPFSFKKKVCLTKNCWNCGFWYIMDIKIWRGYRDFLPLWEKIAIIQRGTEFNSCYTAVALILKSALVWFISESLMSQVWRSASEGIKLKKDFKWLCFSYFDISLHSSYPLINFNIYRPPPYITLRTSLYIRKYHAFMASIASIKDSVFSCLFLDLISSVTRSFYHLIWFCQ